MLEVKLNESYLEGWDEVKELQAKLEKFKKSKFRNRPLPNKWRVGQKVRYITQSEWGWDRGNVAWVIEIRPEYKDKFAGEYQVFYTSYNPEGKGGRYWTTPDDVELIEDVAD